MVFEGILQTGYYLFDSRNQPGGAGIGNLAQPIPPRADNDWDGKEIFPVAQSKQTVFDQAVDVCLEIGNTEGLQFLNCGAGKTGEGDLPAMGLLNRVSMWRGIWLGWLPPKNIIRSIGSLAAKASGLQAVNNESAMTSENTIFFMRYSSC